MLIKTWSCPEELTVQQKFLLSFGNFFFFLQREKVGFNSIHAVQEFQNRENKTRHGGVGERGTGTSARLGSG
jgi:hypothetical protein